TARKISKSSRGFATNTEPLIGGPHGIASRTERHAGVDRGTTLWSRIYRQRSLHEFQPFLHVDESKPLARPCRFDVKSRARVANRKVNFIRRSPQSHFEMAYPTVLRRIVQSLLQNSEEAKRNVRRQR